MSFAWARWMFVSKLQEKRYERAAPEKYNFFYQMKFNTEFFIKFILARNIRSFGCRLTFFSTHIPLSSLLYYVIFGTISSRFHVKYCESVSLRFLFLLLLSFLQVKWATANWCCSSITDARFTWRLRMMSSLKWSKQHHYHCCRCRQHERTTSVEIEDGKKDFLPALISMEKHFQEIFFLNLFTCFLNSMRGLIKI